MLVPLCLKLMVGRLTHAQRAQWQTYMKQYEQKCLTFWALFVRQGK